MRYELFTVVVRTGGGSAWQMAAEWRGTESAPEDVTPDAQLDALAAVLEDGARVDGDLLREIGSTLYRTLFTDGVERLFRRAVDDALAQSKGVLLRLRLEPARAAHLPWEFLYSPAGQQLLAASVRFPVARFLPVRRPVEGGYTVELPLRMLVAVPSGSGLDAATTELGYLREATAELTERRVLVMEVIEGRVTLAALRAALLRFSPHVLHFIGHGDFDGERAYLKLNDEAGNPYAVDDEQIRALLENYPALKLVFLNSCRGATTSAQLSGVGLAPGLLGVGIPSVIAMQYEVEDEAAAAFARSFYTSLFCGADRGRIEVAVSHARSALVQEFTGQRDIGAPVLFMRTREGLLFDIPAPGAASPVVPLAEKDRALAVERALAENLQVRRQCGETPDADAYVKDAGALAAWRSRFVTSNATWAATLTVVLAAMAWVSTTDWYTFYAESWLASTHNRLPLDPRIEVVALNDMTSAYFNRPLEGADWRREHAVLIDRLVTAGVSAIVFNSYFDVPRAGDPDLVAAMGRAKKSGVPVIIAAAALAEDGSPKAIPDIAASAAAIGFSCTDRWYGHLAGVPIVSESEKRYLPSVALAAAYPGFRIAGVDRARRTVILHHPGTRATAEVRFLDTYLAPPARGDDPCYAVPAGTPRALFAFGVADESAFADRTVAYEAVADRNQAPDLAPFKGKLAFVMREAADRSRLDAVIAQLQSINSLLQRYELHRATAVQQGVLALLLAVVGGALRFARRSEEAPRRRVALDLGALVLFAALSAGVSVVSFLAWQLLFNVLAGCISLMAAYVLVGFVRRRWLRPARATSSLMEES